MRVKASACGLEAEEYRAPSRASTRAGPGCTSSRSPRRSSTSSTTGDVSSTPARPSCRATRVSSCSRRGEAVWGGSGPTSRSGSCAATATRSACTAAAPSSASRSTCCSTPTGHRQPRRPGRHGKSALALCAGLESVDERRVQRKVLVFRPLFAVGGQELGYLPGTEAEKMNPWARRSSTPSARSSRRGRRGGHGPGAARGAAPHAHRGRSLHDALSSSTRRSRSSATCCSPSCRASARTARSC